MNWIYQSSTRSINPTPTTRSVGLLLALLLLCGLGLPGAVRADDVMLAPLDDAYVEDLYPNSNFGLHSDLYVGDENYNEPPATCRSYFKFDLGALPPGSMIMSAELMVRSWGVGPNPPIVVNAHTLEDDAWNEATITWANAPTSLSPYPEDIQVVDDTATWYMWFVAMGVETEYLGDGIFSVVLKTDPEGTSHSWCGLHSKESSGTEFDPYLHIDYIPGPEAPLTDWQNLIGVEESDAEWGDFDGDNDLDLALCGISDSGRITRTYENQAGTLVLRQDLAGIQNVGSGCMAWGDYDNDGDLDLAMAGTADSGLIARIYSNDGAGNLTHDSAQALTGVSQASLAWGDVDLDGDLDLVISGMTDTAESAILYENDPPGTLTADTGTILTGSRAGSVDWADWDGDGDPDLLISGYDGTDRRVTFYENDPVGTLTDDGDHGLPGGNLTDAAWGDYDADGDLDLAYTGESGTGGPRFAHIYQNNGSGGLTLVASPLSIYRSSCAWGDLDNDGDLDIAFFGYTGSWITTAIYEYDAGNFNQLLYNNLPDMKEGSLSWADVDDDGDLDFFITGAAFSQKYARLYRNDGTTANTAPAAPTVYTGTQAQFPNGLHLTWSGATDAATPATGLYYNLRVGTTPGTDDVVPGTYGSPLMGNVGQTTDILLRLPPATYYWNVRTIDSGFMASDWGPDQVSAPLNIVVTEIDPCDDAFVESTNPATPFGAAMPQYLYAGDRLGIPGTIDRTYLKFQLTSVPPDSVVMAELHIHRFGGGGSPLYVSAWKEGIDNWDENTITWSNAPTMFSPQPTSTLRVDQAGWCIFDVTQDVITEGQVDGVLTEVLRISTPPEGTPMFLSEFWSDECATTQLRPFLKVWYRGQSMAVEQDDPSTSQLAVRLQLLEPNAPNPFNPSTSIGYTIPRAGHVRLTVFDLNGRLVHRLVDTAQGAGHYTVDWDGRDDAGHLLGPGIYLARVTVGPWQDAGKVILNR